MANSRIYFKSEAGGTTTLSRDTSANSGNLVLPASGSVASVDTAVTDNAIARFDGATGKLQNSGVIIDDNNQLILGSADISSVWTNCSLGFHNTVGTTIRGKAGSVFDLSLYNAGGTSAILSHTPAGVVALNDGKLNIDSAGNVGIGVTPNSSGSSTHGIQTEYNYMGSRGGSSQFMYNAVPSGNSTDKYVASSLVSVAYEQNSTGQHIWKTAPSGTAGNPITWTNAMTLDTSGNLNVGVLNSPIHNFRKSVTLNAGNPILEIAEAGALTTALFYGVSGWSVSGANSAIKVGKDNVTSRSISAGGTINVSGADYAEYEYSNDITLAKGQIVGFKADGTLTDKFSESIRFAIKSTNPSIVGGDIWGNEDIIGSKPEKPIKTEEMTDEEFTALEEQYKTDLADFEERLEAERQKVDRIAYSGKVPVNVHNAKAGQYIIAINNNGSIDGKAVDTPTFEEYLKCVGRVNKILDDGRCEVAVIIH